MLLSSPRPWGCFPARSDGDVPERVFPTPVGVFLYRTIILHWHNGLPHARGGVSIRFHIQKCNFLSSPRPWGCFSLKRYSLEIAEVFPTPVGVFL